MFRSKADDLKTAENTPDDPRSVPADKSRRTVKSYYQYPLRSFLRHKRAYLLLAASILCMVILSTNVLIFYASRYEAEAETLRRKCGIQHTQFYDILPENVPLYTNHPSVRSSLVLPVFAVAENPDLAASFEEVIFTEYSRDAAEFFSLSLTEGTYPTALGEILVSENTARYFSCFTAGEEQKVTLTVSSLRRAALSSEDGSVSETVSVNSREYTMPFRVTGVFSGAECADGYVFCSPETAAYLRGGDESDIEYNSDIYLVFRGKTPTAYKRGLQRLIDSLGIQSQNEKGETVRIGYTERNEMLSEHALLKPYYEGNTMRLMFLFSILPAIIALTVFIYLDMQKNFSELAALSMIGATWKQIFRMQLLKYGAVFCAVFPIGTAGAALLMQTVCTLTNRISPDRVFLWYRFDGMAVFLLFCLCAAILILIIRLLSRRLTGVAYSEMLSDTHRSGSIFVSKTSDLLFSPGHILARISVLFFTRNRRANFLFCSVAALLFCISSFFTMQVAKEYAAVPDSAVMKQSDYILYGDAGVSDAYDTMDPALQTILEQIPGVASVQREFRITDFYETYYKKDIRALISKQLVSNSVINGKFGKTAGANKHGSVSTRLIAMDPELMDVYCGADVVSGSLASLFENEKTVALVVNAWSGSNDKYYQIGDKITLSYSGVELYEAPDDELLSPESSGIAEKKVSWSLGDYTIGAILYRPDEDIHNRIVTVYCSPDDFAALSGIEDVYSYTIRCTDGTPETLSAVSSALASLEYEHLFTVTDMHEELRQAKAQALHTVLYVYLLKFFVLIVTVLLLIAMTRFMLEAREPSLRSMMLIGAENSQLMRMTMLEFLIASAVSSVIGILISLIGTWIISAQFGIRLSFTPFTVFLVFLSMLLLTAVNIGIPILLCRARLRRSRREETISSRPSGKEKHTA